MCCGAASDSSCVSRSSADVYLGLGTNLGDRRDNLARAVGALRAILDVVNLSDTYESDAVGYTDQPRFWNMAVAVRTTLPPGDLLVALKSMERSLGRTATFDQGPRVIDADLLLYGGRIVRTDLLEVPHPRMLERPFVLRPLIDLDPGLRHPATGELLVHRLEALGGDTGLVRVPDAQEGS